MSTPSDPFLKPERLPSWVRNLPEVSTGEATEVVVPPPWPVQLAKRHARPLMAAGGALVLVLVIAAVWPAKKPAVAKAPAPATAPAVVAAPKPAAAVTPALAVAAPVRAAPPPARPVATSSRRKKTASARPARATKATKETSKSRRLERPVAGRG